MVKEIKYLGIEDYKERVRLGVLFAIDLIIINKNGEVLMGKRKNRPAKGYYFLPGGNVLKNENLREALERISQKEVGFKINYKEITLIPKIFEQFYKDNFSGEDFETHCISIGCKYNLKEDFEAKGFDKEHEEKLWLKPHELLKNTEVHDNTKNYFRVNENTAFP
ncbi:MAG: NUDIX domain-containing protein [Candidatus Pacearchaeota archaeon]